MLRILRIFLGTLLILFGVAALAVPILPSSIFLVPGALVLAIDVPRFARFICRIEHRFPRIGKILERMYRILSRHGLARPVC